LKAAKGWGYRRLPSRDYCHSVIIAILGIIATLGIIVTLEIIADLESIATSQSSIATAVSSWPNDATLG